MSDIDDYIAHFDEDTQHRLSTLRELVGELCPSADEAMSYGLIGYKLNGRPLVYFGGFAKHIGVYATPAGHEAFAADFAPYKQGKGSVQFPLTEQLPLNLIRRVVLHRIDTVGDELPAIGAPAVRALATIGVTKISELEGHSEAELLALHGFGPKALQMLRDSCAKFSDWLSKSP